MKKALLAAALVFATAAFAHEEHRAGDLVIDHPTIRATPAGAPVSGGYLTIRNTGDEADRLVGGSADFAGKVEIHEMAMDGEVMTMREIAGGIEIPPGGEVVLKPGGLHVMFMQLDQGLAEGDELPATLTFERAGDVEIIFDVQSLAQIREHLGGEAMDDGSMDHSN